MSAIIRIMKLNLTPVIAAIAITLVIVMVINAPTVLISIAYAGLDNFLFSNKASSAIYNQGITSLATINATTIPGISVDRLPPEALITIKTLKMVVRFHFRTMTVQLFRTERKYSHQSL